MLAYSLEISKGVFAALFGYAGSKLTKEYSTPKTRALAQGIFNGCYSGFAPFIAGVIGYNLLGSSSLTYKGSDLRGLFIFTGTLGSIGLLLICVLIVRDSLKRMKPGIEYTQEEVV
jgi:MFS family permease